MNDTPILWVHPAYLEQNILAAEATPIRLSVNQIPFYSQETIDKLTAELAAATARADANEKDAERYRKLRAVDPDAELPTVMLHHQNPWGQWMYSPLLGKKLDAAIDSARSAK